MHYDAIILGLGGMGSATAWHLARRGRRVLGLDPFGVAHDRGSSHGGSRLIRRAYFEHPDYVPLVTTAYRLWEELEAAFGKKLFHRTGLFLAGRSPGMVIDGIRRAASAYNLAIEELSVGEARRRVPGLRPDDGMTVLYEVDAGFLEVENCVRAHCEQAAACGADLRTNEGVISWKSDSGGVRVETDKADYRGTHLVLCGGAWSGRLLADLGISLSIRRKVVVWYQTNAGGYRVGKDCPVFCFDTPAGFYYGFPTFDGLTIKVGEHSGGQAMQDPDQLDREVHDADLAPLATFIERHLPIATTKVVTHSVCMYTMTPDEHFIIDRHPQHENVFFACGFSGHGFKFASVIGSVLADLVTRGTTQEPVGFLRLNRFRRATGP